MKEIQEKKQDEISVHAQAEINKIRQFKASIKRKPGLTLFCYDAKSQSLKKAEIRETVVVLNGEYKTKREVDVLSEYEAYFYALNFKSAIKKLNKLGFKVK